MSLNQSPIPDEAPERTAESAAPAKPKCKASLKWLILTPVILIVIAAFGFLFYCVLGGSVPEITPPSTSPATEVTTPTVMEMPTEPGYEILSAPPADGNPDDITSKGSYTVTDGNRGHLVVATAGKATLTNAQLQVYYWQEVYTYLSQNADPGFSLDHGLDVQMCGISETPMTWQQYFLQRAINTWHTYQALALDSEAKEYGLDESYYAYLSSLPEALAEKAGILGCRSADSMAAEVMGAGVTAEELIQYVRLYETGHSYFDRVYQQLLPSEDEVKAYYLANSESYDQISGSYVDFRHILLIPENDTDEAWDSCRRKAQDVNYRYLIKPKETTFAQLAFEYSADTGSNNNGGLYANVPEGMFIEEINDWCFDAKRTKGNTAVIKSSVGYHILYFRERHEIRDSKAEQDLIAAKVSLLVPEALQNHPLTVNYRTIQIPAVQLRASDASTADRAMILHDLCQAFPDGTYQRYTSFPLYIQQDYGHVPYGGAGNTVVTHGCGIVTLAMLATYMTDTEQSVEKCSAMFYHYSSPKGTSWDLFDDAPLILGFYGAGRAASWNEAYAALEEGKIVISLQHEGFFTRGGHYLLLYAITDEGKIMMRDSNLFNYTQKFVDTDYYENGFPVEMFIPANRICWIIEPKVTQIAVCARCGSDEADTSAASLLLSEYTCPKCITALHLRQVYDTACDIDLLDQIKPPVLDESIEITEPEPVRPTYEPEEEPEDEPEEEPTEPTDPAEPTEPSTPAEPTEPSTPSEPGSEGDGTQPSDPSDTPEETPDTPTGDPTAPPAGGTTDTPTGDTTGDTGGTTENP